MRLIKSRPVGRPPNSTLAPAPMMKTMGWLNIAENQENRANQSA
jgi:hypothetical protein